jgi:hypothetical protein
LRHGKAVGAAVLIALLAFVILSIGRLKRLTASAETYGEELIKQ